MKKMITVLLAALMMMGFASCLDRNRMDDYGYRDNNNANNLTQNRSVPAEISSLDFYR